MHQLHKQDLSIKKKRNWEEEICFPKWRQLVVWKCEKIGARNLQ
jgi:hypothetical protein